MSPPNAVARLFLLGTRAVFSCVVLSKVPFTDLVGSDIVRVMVLSDHGLTIARLIDTKDPTCVVIAGALLQTTR